MTVYVIEVDRTCSSMVESVGFSDRYLAGRCWGAVLQLLGLASWAPIESPPGATALLDLFST
jgi:hypothetical protein